jgi:hypothetical protein
MAATALNPGICRTSSESSPTSDDDDTEQLVKYKHATRITMPLARIGTLPRIISKRLPHPIWFQHATTANRKAGAGSAPSPWQSGLTTAQESPGMPRPRTRPGDQTHRAGLASDNPSGSPPPNICGWSEAAPDPRIGPTACSPVLPSLALNRVLPTVHAHCCLAPLRLPDDIASEGASFRP